LIGREHAFLGMMPAHERLDGADPARPGIDDRLIVQFEFMAGLSLPETRSRWISGRPRFRLEHAEIVSSTGFRGIERQIRFLQQHLDVVAMFGAKAIPMLVPTLTWWPSISKGFSIKAMSLRARRMAPSRWSFSFSWMMANSSPPRRANHVGIAKRRLQALRDLNQKLIAGRMPQRVIDLLELVEIDHQHREDDARGAAAASPLHRVFQRTARDWRGPSADRAGARYAMCLVAGALGDVVMRGEQPPSGISWRETAIVRPSASCGFPWHGAPRARGSSPAPDRRSLVPCWRRYSKTCSSVVPGVIRAAVEMIDIGVTRVRDHNLNSPSNRQSPCDMLLRRASKRDVHRFEFGGLFSQQLLATLLLRDILVGCDPSAVRLAACVE